MAFADRIRFVDDPEIKRAWAEQFERLSGFEWPPKNSAEWTIILNRAGFSQQRIEQFLAEIGVEGFDDAGELPRAYVSAGPGDLPTFSASLIAGLARWGAWQHPSPAPGQSTAIGTGGQASANARMIDTLAKMPESRDWSAAQFADHLGLSKGTIGKTPAWKALMATRESEKLDRIDRGQAV